MEGAVFTVDFDVEVLLEDVLVDLEGADTLWDGCEDVDVDASTGVGVSVFTCNVCRRDFTWCGLGIGTLRLNVRKCKRVSTILVIVKVYV